MLLIKINKQIHTQKKQIIMVVLGCAMDELQEDRVNAAIKYAEKEIIDGEIIWYLTGKVKNALNKNQNKKTDAVVTEASKMAAQLDSNNKIKSNDIWLDEEATNTSENFAYLKKRLATFPHQNMPEIVITTSEFHKDRAEKIFNGIFEDTEYQAKWNLSLKACPTCWNDEEFHKKNVPKDVINALLLIQNNI